MDTVNTIKSSSAPYNPAKSWKMLFLFAPVALVFGAVVYRSEVASSTARQALVRPMSAADGTVHVVAPQSELDMDLWDGNITWHPYPKAASYDVMLFREPGKVLWQQSSDTDQITLHTEAFPYALRHLIDTSMTMGYKVIARDQAGKVIADSGPQSFYLRVLPQVGYIY